MGINKIIDVTYCILLLLAYMIQGAAEEVLCRGFMMPSLMKRVSALAAIMISATVFALPHFASLFEAGVVITIIGIVNLYLISFVFVLLILCRTNIWISCALHSIWNFVLYGVFGLTVSSVESDMTGILCFQSNSLSIINGGIYGIESSIVTTVVLGIVVVVLWKYWKAHKMESEG